MAVNWNTADEFTALMKYRAISENKKKMQEFATLFEELIEKVNKITVIRPKENSIVATIKFTAQEIAQMGVEVQKEIKATGKVARVIKTIKNGEITYEIRYRRNGYNLSVISTDLIEAKQKFIQKTKLKNMKIGA